ncbi:MAG: ClpXP protease specificity-enhancing factor [Agitococcus sp.]
MTPSRPYLVRAIYEWLVDNNATPYILIDATHAYSRVPQQHVKDGKIVLNVAPHAVKDLLIGNDGLSFSARFGGVPMNVSAPMVAVLAIYARENGQGMFFDNHDEFDNQDSEQPALQEVPSTQMTPVSEAPKKRPILTVVK